MISGHNSDMTDKKAPICKGQAFIGANPQTERLIDLYDAVKRVTGANSYDLTAPSNRRSLLIHT